MLVTHVHLLNQPVQIMRGVSFSELIIASPAHNIEYFVLHYTGVAEAHSYLPGLICLDIARHIRLPAEVEAPAAHL